MSKIKLLILQFIFLMAFAAPAHVHAEVTDKDIVLKIKTETNDLPQEILDLDEDAWISKSNAPYELTLVLLNDNIPVKGRSGDDFGYTHALKIISSKKTENGMRITLKYTSDLYAQKAGILEADGRTPQYFTDENLATLILDNLEQNRLWYWKAEIGWHQLNHKVMDNFFYASTQQDYWHHIKKSFDESTRIPRPAEEGETNNGMMGDAAIGLHKEIRYKNTGLKAAAEAGHRQSSHKDADYEYAAIELGSSYTIHNNYAVALTAKVLAKNHSTGTEYNYSLNAALHSTNWELGMAVTQFDGELNNYVQYNLPSRKTKKPDAVYETYVNYKFGPASRNK